VKTIAQLDCLISLARSSRALGEPSCRPEFVESSRSVLDFEELRHPCMVPTVGDFIPNDIKLGGDSAKITLLTGANAAGKSTILRMVCIFLVLFDDMKTDVCRPVSESSWHRSDATYQHDQLG